MTHASRTRPAASLSKILRTLAALTALCFSFEAAAKIEIEIPEVSAQVADNVRAFLSLTRYAERDDVDADVMTRLQRRIVTETRDALQPLGYYEPEVAYDVQPDGGDWRVVIRIKPGRPVRLSEVLIDATGPGAGERAIREVVESGVLKPGLRLNHGVYERLKGDLVRVAKNEGYLDARLARHELVIDRDERRANVALLLETGERYRYGPIDVTQDVIEDSAMRRLLRMKPGDPYTLDSLLRTQYVLDDTLYFGSVDIETGEIDREARIVPMTVTATPNRKHRFGASVGYGTDTEARGKFTWDNRRVNRKGHRFKLELLGSTPKQELAARYVIPVMDIALEKLEFTGAISDEELGDTLSERYEVGSGLTQVMGDWQRVLFLRVLNETSTVKGSGQSTEDFLLIPGVSYSSLPSYIVGGRGRPYFFYAELRGSPSSLGSGSSFLQVRLEGERLFDLSELWSLRLRAEIGASRVADFSELPVSQRFFAGGERSVRGFALNDLSPTDENGKRIGGENLATGTIEITRALPRNFGVAAFYDVGNAFDSFEDPQLEYSVGLGVRYNIAVASFGLDLAQALSEPGQNPRVHLYISTQF